MGYLISLVLGVLSIYATVYGIAWVIYAIVALLREGSLTSTCEERQMKKYYKELDRLRRISEKK